MAPPFIAAALFLALVVLGDVLLRRVSATARLLFDGAGFLAISAYFYSLGVFPIFSPLDSATTPSAIALRAIGGGWWLFAARLSVAGLRALIGHDRRSREARLFSDLAAAAIYLATGAVVLSSVFALPVSGVVATSGVVAIVLGLALQNTLADVFAGIAVGVEAPFGIGDRVRIGDNIEGQVVQVNWRSIRVQTDGDDIAIIPNSIVAKAQIVNRSFPNQQRSASVEYFCPSFAPPERVIEHLVHATMLCPHILKAHTPSALLTHLGRERNRYEIAFVVESTAALSKTKDMLLRSVRRQLHYSGLLERSPADAPGLDARDEIASARRLTRGLILFEGLPDAQLDAVAAALRPNRLEPGDILFAEGSTDQTLFLIASGVLEVARKREGSVETLGCIGAGEYIGEIGLLTGVAHAATVTARTHCLVCSLPREGLATLLAEHEFLAAALERSARRGLDILERRVVVSVTPGVGARGQLLAKIQSLFRHGGA